MLTSLAGGTTRRIFKKVNTLRSPIELSQENFNATTQKLAENSSIHFRNIHIQQHICSGSPFWHWLAEARNIRSPFTNYIEDCESGSISLIGNNRIALFVPNRVAWTYGYLPIVLLGPMVTYQSCCLDQWLLTNRVACLLPNRVTWTNGYCPIVLLGPIATYQSCCLDQWLLPNRVARFLPKWCCLDQWLLPNHVA